MNRPPEGLRQNWPLRKSDFPISVDVKQTRLPLPRKNIGVLLPTHLYYLKLLQKLTRKKKTFKTRGIETPTLGGSFLTF